MGLNIKNPKIEAAIRELASLRGVGLTEAIGEAVEQALNRVSDARRLEIERVKQEIIELTDQIARARGPNAPTWAELEEAMYDEHGLPV